MALSLTDNSWLSERVRECINVFLEPSRLERDWNQGVFRWLGRLAANDPLSPQDLYIATLIIWQWLQRISFRAAIEHALVDWLSEAWSQVATQQSFALRRPRITGPAILDASQDSRRDLSRLALILVAAEDGVERVGLAQELRRRIRDSLT